MREHKVDLSHKSIHRLSAVDFYDSVKPLLEVVDLTTSSQTTVILARASTTSSTRMRPAAAGAMEHVQPSDYVDEEQGEVFNISTPEGWESEIPERDDHVDPSPPGRLPLTSKYMAYPIGGPKGVCARRSPACCGQRCAPTR